MKELTSAANRILMHEYTGSERRVIPITGGKFYGRIEGEVLNLGFDALVMQSDMTAKYAQRHIYQHQEHRL